MDESNSVAERRFERDVATTTQSGRAGADELAARRAERQRELLENALAESDATRAAMGSAVADLLEFLPMIKSAAAEVAAATTDAEQRLAKLRQPLQMYVTICRLARNLP